MSSTFREIAQRLNEHPCTPQVNDRNWRELRRALDDGMVPNAGDLGDYSFTQYCGGWSLASNVDFDVTDGAQTVCPSTESEQPLPSGDSWDVTSSRIQIKFGGYLNFSTVRRISSSSSESTL